METQRHRPQAQGQEKLGPRQGEALGTNRETNRPRTSQGVQAPEGRGHKLEGRARVAGGGLCPARPSEDHFTQACGVARLQAALVPRGG